MAFVRILVDGYSLLHAWPELASGYARYSEAARDELLRTLTQYQDASGTPVTVVFDGRGQSGGPRKTTPRHEVEVLYSTDGRTADDLIERAAHRLSAYGEVLVVTNDRAERETVNFVGGLVSSCFNFICTVESTLESFRSQLDRRNRGEQRAFRLR